MLKFDKSIFFCTQQPCGGTRNAHKYKTRRRKKNNQYRITQNKVTCFKHFYTTILCMLMYIKRLWILKVSLFLNESTFHRRIQVLGSNPGGAQIFRTCQNLCEMGTWSFFSGAKAIWFLALTTSLRLEVRLQKEQIYTFALPVNFHGLFCVNTIFKISTVNYSNTCIVIKLF